MRKLIGLFALLALLGTQICFAQTREITGTVLDKADNSPLPGVSVIIKGSQPPIGTSTDINGRFTLRVSETDVLVFSFMGMKNTEVAVVGKNNISVPMESASEQLDELIVVAYGTQKKSSFTGSAASVSGDKVLKDMPVASFEQALQGSTPGVQINANSGQPGGAINIRIRGTGSMNASKNPLYVIDGVPVVSGDIAVSGVTGDSKAFNSMVSLNPDDIESISILKDAAAASLYGSRAANGVILITTKKGKKGKTSINFKANYGQSDWAVDNRKMLDGDKQHELTYEAYYNEGVLYKGYTESEAAAYAQQGANLYAPKLDKYSNWEKAIFNSHGTMQNYEVSAQGGSESTTFYSSLAYKKEEGMADISMMEGFTGKLNVTHQSSDKLNFGGNVSFAKQHSRVSSEGTAYSNPFFMTRYVYKPNVPIYNEDGSYYEGFPLANLNLPNIVKDNGLEKNMSDVFRSTNSIWASYEIIKGLTLKQTLSYDFILNESTTHWPIASNNGELHSGLMIKIDNQHHNIYSSSVLNYATTIKDVHNVDVLVGWDADRRKERYLYATAKNYGSDKLPEMENASEPTVARSGRDEDHMLSILSRINYDYNNKYYASVTYRRDGSSRLGEDKRWGDFWSVSGAWRITQEDFMSDSKDWLSDLKLRVSYGVNGTLPSSLYSHLSLVRSGYNYQDEPGTAPTTIPNPNLAWEKNHNLNIGFDATFLDRIYLTFDYYTRNTKDLLQSVPTSLVTGFSSSIQNVGEMKNEGFEIDLSVDVFKEGEVYWNTGLAIAHNYNKITKLYGGKDIIDGTSILREGKSYYAFWTRQWAGVDPATGEEMWVLNTENPDGSLNKELTKDPGQAQRVVAGKPDPKVTGGWRNTVSWKGLSFNALFAYSFGGHVLDMNRISFTDFDGYRAYYNISKSQYNRWQKPGDKTNVPRRINNYQYGNYGSDRFMKKSDYIRLKTASLSYSLPKKILTPVGLETVRVFASGANLWTWSKYKHLDPEQPVDGRPGWAWPMLKTYTFGIEIGL